ncbi:hypothetical protein RZS08_38520, partial [Arthrospira platensis SPKY1]|nr:hypothetical protein [Arthrospira platensis SPKY1]
MMQRPVIRFFIPLLACLGLFLGNAPLAAQTVAEAEAKTGRVTQFVPALAYNSDMGLLGGGMLTRFNYGDGQLKPFQSYELLALFVTTKGFATTNYFRDQVNAFDS